MTDAREPDERALVDALRQGDERAFAALVDAYSPALLRVARAHVPSRAVAEEVVQEAWLAVVRGLDRFEGRSSLKTWIFKIVTNIACSRGARERRIVPFSALAAAESANEPSVDPDRFFPPNHSRAGHWSLAPRRWQTPEEQLLAGEGRQVALAAIADLPPAQRTVIVLRDVEGWDAHDVCDALGISEGNQRVLLHRARSKVRAALERYHAALDQTLPVPTVPHTTTTWLAPRRRPVAAAVAGSSGRASVQ
jgi:RNA polymerase sigma-70 factor, ECF subfamily